ncbi:MAG: PDZ domain-containing protein, partial [Bacteroidetes bacterium]
NAMAQNRLEEAAEALEERMERLGEQLENAFEQRWDDWEEKAWLGLRTEPVSEDKARRKGWPHRYGAYVVQVVPGSPADEAGIEPFDYIIAVDGEPLDRFHDLKDLLADKKAGTTVTLTVIRAGKTIELRARLSSRTDLFRNAAWRPPTVLGLVADGTPDERGVPVQVVPGSLMDRLGVRDGDRIQAINGHEIIDWQDVKIAARNLSPGDEVVVTIYRDGETRTLKGRVGKEGGRTSEWYEPQGQDRPQQRPWLGVEYSHPPQWKLELWGIDNPHGILVTRVLPGSPAERAGLKALDYLIGIDGQEVDEATSFTSLLRAHQPGDRIELTLVRKGERRTLSVLLASANERTEPAPLDDCQRPFLGVQQYDDLVGKRGIRVNVVPGGTAARAGMKDGDVLLSLDGYAILEWSDLTLALRNTRPGQVVTLEYEHNGQQQEKRVALASRAEAKNCPDCDCAAQGASAKGASSDSPHLQLSESTEQDVARVTARIPRLADARYAPTLAGVEVHNQSDGVLVRLHSDVPSDASIWLLGTDGQVRYEFEIAGLEGASEDFIRNDLLPSGSGTLVILLGKNFTIRHLKSD